MKKRKRLTKEEYYKYLNGAHWENTKKRFKKDKCEICGSRERLELHHLNYKHIGNETKEDVVTLCRYCHGASHLVLFKGKWRHMRHPSSSTMKIIKRLREGNGVSKSRVAFFIRRIFAVVTNGKDVPPMKYFRKIVSTRFYSYKKCYIPSDLPRIFTAYIFNQAEGEATDKA